MKKTLGQLKNELQHTHIYDKMNHNIYANPNMKYHISINIVSKAKLTHIPKSTNDITNVKKRTKILDSI